MTSRDVRAIAAWILFPIFAVFHSYLVTTHEDRLTAVVGFFTTMVALYIGLDVLLAPETSLPYRINKWWGEPEILRFGALLFVIISLVSGYGFMRAILGMSP